MGLLLEARVAVSPPNGGDSRVLQWDPAPNQEAILMHRYTTQNWQFLKRVITITSASGNTLGSDAAVFDERDVLGR